MVTSRDAYDDWYEDDEHGEAGDRWDDGPARPLELVRRPRFAFEVVAAPESFEVAQTIADRLRGGSPVLVDLRGCERAALGPPHGLLQRPGLRPRGRAAVHRRGRHPADAEPRGRLR